MSTCFEVESHTHMSWRLHNNPRYFHLNDRFSCLKHAMATVATSIHLYGSLPPSKSTLQFLLIYTESINLSALQLWDCLANVLLVLEVENMTSPVIFTHERTSSSAERYSDRPFRYDQTPLGTSHRYCERELLWSTKFWGALLDDRLQGGIDYPNWWLLDWKYIR